MFSEQLSRKDSKDSASGKSKTEKTPSSASNGLPPPPPPNNAKPQLPQLPATSSSSLNISFGGGAHSVTLGGSAASNGPYGTRSSAHAGSGQAPSTPDRRFQSDRSSPAPPIVVVSPDAHADVNTRGGYAGPERTSLGGDVPRAGTLNRLRQTPKDTIPIIGKPPRKQRSSRFVPSEKVEIERLPPFSGESYLVYRCNAKY